MNGPHHRLFVVEVAAEDVDIASDLLWSAGAQAVEEVATGDGVELLTDLGDDPMSAWNALVLRAPRAGDWRTRIKLVERSVTDSWRDHVEDIEIGEIRIVPAWKTNVDDDDGPERILIDPGGAFGMGDHPTTRATLTLALARTQASPARPSVLDIGCGSGILGIALARMRGARIVAVDIAPAAIEATKANSALNQTDNRIIVELGAVDVVRGSYDLVLANILAPVLLVDAERIAQCVASRGGLILSGFTPTRLDDITAAYTRCGLHLVKSVEVDGWLAVEMERP